MAQLSTLGHIAFMQKSNSNLNVRGVIVSIQDTAFEYIENTTDLTKAPLIAAVFTIHEEVVEDVTLDKAIQIINKDRADNKQGIGCLGVIVMSFVTLVTVGYPSDHPGAMTSAPWLAAILICAILWGVVITIIRRKPKHVSFENPNSKQIEIVRKAVLIELAAKLGVDYGWGATGAKGLLGYEYLNSYLEDCVCEDVDAKKYKRKGYPTRRNYRSKY